MPSFYGYGGVPLAFAGISALPRNHSNHAIFVDNFDAYKKNKACTWRFGIVKQNTIVGFSYFWEFSNFLAMFVLRRFGFGADTSAVRCGCFIGGTGRPGCGRATRSFIRDRPERWEGTQTLVISLVNPRITSHTNSMRR